MVLACALTHTVHGAIEGTVSVFKRRSLYSSDQNNSKRIFSNNSVHFAAEKH